MTVGVGASQCAEMTSRARGVARVATDLRYVVNASVSEALLNPRSANGHGPPPCGR
jgi:hypothetical protein